MDYLLEKLDELIAAIKSVTAKAKAYKTVHDNMRRAIDANTAAINKLSASQGNYVTVETYNRLVSAHSSLAQVVSNLNTLVSNLDRRVSVLESKQPRGKDMAS